MTVENKGHVSEVSNYLHYVYLHALQKADKKNYN